ncbi:MAG: MBL fold metallo-hydrolase [Candidatus Peribacteraceae bacterium]|nr:MBL fold metallo-hydrolase [Candidatus Peribacteraceae bacterium]
MSQRHSRSSIAIWLVITIFFVAFLTWHEVIHLPDGKTHVSFLAVGQGDSTLIVSPSGKRIVIDGGPDLTTLEHLGSHLGFFNRHIDILILTHPHLDHIASFPQILKRYSVGQILMSGADYTQPRYAQMLAEMKAQNIALLLSQPGKTIDIGDGLVFDMLWPPSGAFGTYYSNPHDEGVVVRARFGNQSALFTGDLEEKYEEKILESKLDIRADILKVGHHGSLTSTSTGFLIAVHPDLAIISVGKNNLFRHPRQAILDRLNYFNIPYKRTDLDGTIEVVWK